MKSIFLTVVLALRLAAQTAVVDSHLDCLLGGWRDGAWVDGNSTGAWLRAGQPFGLFNWGGSVGDLIGGKPRPISGPCGDGMEVPFSSELPPDSVAIATDKAHGTQPRVPEKLGLNSRTYLSEFRKLLDLQGIRSAVRIVQLLRVDLDGDGKMEVLAALEQMPGGRTYSRPGEYSLLAVRRVDSADRIHTEIIDSEKHPREGGITQMRFGPPVDLNGDGKLELIVRGTHVKGKYTHVLEMRGGKFIRVLECTCGE